MKVLVTGGTGTLGRRVVARLHDGGHEVRVLSRRRPEGTPERIEFVAGDLTSGVGIDAAVEGAEVIAHCAGTNSGDDVKARNLVLAVARMKTPPRHLLNVSVVGADRVPGDGGIDRMMFGYFSSKLAAERVVANSGVPWTTLRATQFHQLLFVVAQQMGRLPVVPVAARSRFQPVDADEVAEYLVALALGGPLGLAPEIAGPRIYGMDELLRLYLRSIGKQRVIVPLWLPSRGAAAIRAGANLAPDRAVGRRTWEEFLSERDSRGGREALAVGRAAG